MKLLIRCACAVILLFGSQIAFAQQDLRPGYVITHNNDTIRGQVVLVEGDGRFANCTFIGSGGSSQTYLPDDLKGYGISGGSLYISRPLPLNGASVTNTFSELLVTGKANLLFAYDRQFIDTGDGRIHELIQSKEVVYKNGVAYVQTAYKFRTTLRQNLAGCSSVASMIDNAILTIKSMSKIVRRYNACFSDKPGVASKRQKMFKIYAGIVAGYSSVKLDNFSGTELESNVDASQFTDRIFFPGIAFEIKSPALNENFGLHLDLFYQKNSFESFFKSENIYKTTSWNFQSVNTPLTLSYSYARLSAFRLFIEAGISPYWTRNNETFYREDIESGNSIQLNTSDNSSLSIDDQFSIFFLGGAGISYQPVTRAGLSLRARYESASFNINPSQAINRNCFTVAASLLFKISK
jgi:hypothetical protein